MSDRSMINSQDPDNLNYWQSIVDFGMEYRLALRAPHPIIYRKSPCSLYFYCFKRIVSNFVHETVLELDDINIRNTHQPVYRFLLILTAGGRFWLEENLISHY